MVESAAAAAEFDTSQSRKAAAKDCNFLRKIMVLEMEKLISRCILYDASFRHKTLIFEFKAFESLLISKSFCTVNWRIRGHLPGQ